MATAKKVGDVGALKVLNETVKTWPSITLSVNRTHDRMWIVSILGDQIGGESGLIVETQNRSMIAAVNSAVAEMVNDIWPDCLYELEGSWLTSAERSRLNTWRRKMESWGL